MNRIFKPVVFGAKKVIPTVVLKSGKLSPGYKLTVNETKKTASLIAETNDFKDSIYFTYNNGEVICRRVFENVSGKKLELCELGFEIEGIDFGGDKRDDYFYHNENPRIYGAYTIPVDFDRLSAETEAEKWGMDIDITHADPETIVERIGASPYQPFPAVLVSNYGIKGGLVHGTLSQDVFFHNYLLSHENDGLKLNILSSFKGIDALEMGEGRIIVDEWYLGRTDEADNIEKIFAKYTDKLREKLPNAYGRTDINRKSLVWGSWNDGILRNVSEDLMIEEAQFLSDNFPTVNWVQLDDGYSPVCTKIAHGLGLPYEGDEGIDKEKFPHGLKWMTDKIRETGLRPALWIGGFVPHIAPLYKDHPDWFLDYSYRVGNTSPLDVSQPQVREYMISAANTLCRKYGFEGVKHDFWSYAFEDSHNMFKNKDRSGYEYRRWWTSSLKDCLPKDGYLQTGCDLVMGNPFLAEYFTNYRYGLDVGSGEWNNVKTVFHFGAACFATHTGDIFPPNSDAVGLLEGLNKKDREFLLNYVIATHSMVELAGRLSKVTDKEKIKSLKKVVCNPNNGQDVYFIGFDYRSKRYAVPEIMYFNSPHFSPEENNALMPVRTVALFNIGEENKKYSFSAEDLGIPCDCYKLTDVWSEETFELKNFEIELEAHESRLLAVTNCNAVIIDANIRINSVKAAAGKVIAQTDYAEKEAELTLAAKPVKLVFDGSEIPFEVKNGKTVFALPGKGKLEIIF
ncbi:MAG: alpha-galactosidase [Monoglobales bacterium]